MSNVEGNAKYRITRNKEFGTLNHEGNAKYKCRSKYKFRYKFSKEPRSKKNPGNKKGRANRQRVSSPHPQPLSSLRRGELVPLAKFCVSVYPTSEPRITILEVLY
jgi:hypothetical protein